MSGFLSNEPDVPPIDPISGVLPGTTGNADPWVSGVAGSAGQSLGLGTGQQGFTPVTGTTGGGMGAWIQSLRSWLEDPIKTPSSPANIALIVGVVIVAIVLWNFVLYHLRLAAETI